MKNKRVSWSLPAIAIIVLVYILTLFNWQAILPKVELASAKEEKTYVKPTTLAELQKADPAEVAKQSSFDGRFFGIETEVKDQGQSNLCWAYATAHTVEASLLRSGLVPLRDKKNLDINANNIANNTFNMIPDPLGNNWESHVEDLYWNQAGQTWNPVHIFSQWRGLINNVLGSTNYLGFEKNLYQLDKAIYLPNDDRMAIKQAIVQYGAVSTSLPVPSSYTKYYHEDNAHLVQNHVCSIIGWDDNISAGSFTPHQPKSDGAWIVKNSWGPNKHENGYFYMSYETDIAKLVAFDFLPNQTYHNNYFYDISTSTKMIQSIRQNSTKPLQAASIYEVKRRTASQKEYIKAVNVGVETANTTCTVEVYTGLDSLYAVPTSGTLATTITKTFQYGGFYTIDLEKKIDLDDSNYFSIVVKVQNPTNTAGMYAERDDLSHDDFAYFYDEEIQQWTETKYKNSGCIPRIKAYTVNEKRTEEISKTLTFVTVDIPTEQKRVDYNEKEQCPDFSLKFNGKILTKDVDYTLTYQNNKFPGVATALYTGIGEYKSTKVVNWTIVKPANPPNLPGEAIANSNRRSMTVDASVQYFKDIALPSGWSWVFSDNPVVSGVNTLNHVQYYDKDNYERYMYDVVVTKTAGTVQKIDISNCNVTLHETSYTYTGSSIKPKVTVKNGGTTLVENVDYVLQYENNVKVGRATIIVKGSGVNYNGEKRITFDIIQAQEPASKPAPIREIFSNESLATINWGDGWKLQNENEEIPVGTTKTITLIRVDAEGYVNATCTVTVTRSSEQASNPEQNQKPPMADVTGVTTKPEQATESTKSSNMVKIVVWSAIIGGGVIAIVAVVFKIKRK